MTVGLDIVVAERDVAEARVRTVRCGCDTPGCDTHIYIAGFPELFGDLWCVIGWSVDGPDDVRVWEQLALDRDREEEVIRAVAFVGLPWHLMTYPQQRAQMEVVMSLPAWVERANLTEPLYLRAFTVSFIGDETDRAQAYLRACASCRAYAENVGGRPVVVA